MRILFKLLTLERDISRTIWRIDVTDGSFFQHFSTLFQALTFFDWSFPSKEVTYVSYKSLIVAIFNECICRKSAFHSTG